MSSVCAALTQRVTLTRLITAFLRCPEKAYIQTCREDTSQGQFSEEYSFIRKRTTINADGQAAGSVYGWTNVQKTPGGQAIEKKRIITKREYMSLFHNRDPARHVVRQQRISFLWEVQSFTIHAYREPVSDLCLLHAQVKATPHAGRGDGGGVALPPFLEVDETPLADAEGEDQKHSAYYISLKR